MADRQWVGIACAGLIAIIALGSTPQLVVAEDQTSAEQIRDALLGRVSRRAAPSPSTAASGPPRAAPTPELQRALATFVRRPARSLTQTERQWLGDAAERTTASIDLEINFDFNSAILAPNAVPLLRNLGIALGDPRLKGGVFLVAGHTDGKGGDTYNQDLSERRAETVKRFLIQNSGASAESLVVVGFGKSKLKNQTYPFADENRRVQVVNMTAQ